MTYLCCQLRGLSNTTSLLFDIKKDRGAKAPRSHSSPNRFAYWLRPYFFLAAFFAAFLRLAGAFLAAFFAAFLRFAGAFLATFFAAFLRFAAMIFSLVRYYFLRFGFNSLFSVELEVNFIAVLAGT